MVTVTYRGKVIPWTAPKTVVWFTSCLIANRNGYTYWRESFASGVQ